MLPNQWRSLSSILSCQVGHVLYDWIAEPRSMTVRLRKHAKRNMKIVVLDQSWSQPRAEERDVLGLSQHARIVAREVLLLCDGKPWMYARSIFPKSTLRGKGRCLHELGVRPLGEWMYKDPCLRRVDIQVTPLRAHHKNYQDAAMHVNKRLPSVLWSRRARFILASGSLLVTEVFLPAIPNAYSKELL